MSAGAPWGGLGIVYAETRCDADCTIGGRGLTVSPVMRVIAARSPTRTLGGFLRIIHPTNENRFFGYSNGPATLFLIGLDLGFGRG